MTALSSTDPARFLHDQLLSASPDLLRLMLTTFINTLMSAEADAVCGAPYGMPDPGRINPAEDNRVHDMGLGSAGRDSGRRHCGHDVHLVDR